MPFVLRFLTLILVPGAVGASVALIRGLPWRVDEQAAQRELTRLSELEQRMSELRATRGVSLDELRSMLTAGVVVIDARAVVDYERAHLLTEHPAFPPTLNVEPEQAAAQQDRLTQLIGQPLLLYCNALDCHLSEELLLELEKLGFRTEDIRIFFPGWAGIIAAGLPTAHGPDRWTGIETQPADSPDQTPSEPETP